MPRLKKLPSTPPKDQPTLSDCISEHPAIEKSQKWFDSLYLKTDLSTFKHLSRFERARKRLQPLYLVVN